MGQRNAKEGLRPLSNLILMGREIYEVKRLKLLQQPFVVAQLASSLGKLVAEIFHALAISYHRISVQ